MLHLEDNKNVLKLLTGFNESMTLEDIKLWLIQHEKKKMGARISRARLYAAKQGKVLLGAIPYGFKYEGGKLLIDSIESKVVIEIFKQLDNGDTVSEVSKKLNTLGYVTKRGKKWTPTSVRRIAKSKYYVGEFYFNKTKVIFNNDGTKKNIRNPEEEWIKINIDRIVSDKLFYNVQKKLNNLTLQF